MTTTTFDYKVRDQHGNLVRGKIEADSVPLVATRLREMGYLPIEIKAPAAINLRGDIEIPGLTTRVKLKEIAVMSRQLSTMVTAGLTLVRALSVLADQLDSKPLCTALLAVRNELEQGRSFSAALEQHPKIFSPLYVSMVKAGEIGGQLDTVLAKLATMIEKQVELRSKIRSAMYYPAFVLFVVIAVMAALMIFVVPTFKHLYATLHGTLPLPTKIVIHVSNIIASVWSLAVIFAIGAAVFGVRHAIRTDRGRHIFDALKLRPPVFGPLAHKIALARCAGTLSSMIGAGVGIIEALDITADNVGNVIIADALRGSISGVREGQPLAATLSAYDVMPRMLTQMIDTGEESGAVAEMLDKVATFYDGEVSTMVASLTSLIEPMIIVFMGLCVGTVVISMYLPMFKYVTLIKPGQ